MLTTLLNEYKARRDAAQTRWEAAYNAVTEDVVSTDFNGSDKLAQLQIAEREARDELNRCEGAIDALTALLAATAA